MLEHNVFMTVYVDDMFFSSECTISKFSCDKVEQIIRKYGYRISKKKVKNYSKLYPKLITGVIIDSNGNPTVKNSLRQKIVNEHQHLRDNAGDTNSRRRLRGLLTAARQIDRNIYPTIHRFAFNGDE